MTRERFMLFGAFLIGMLLGSAATYRLTTSGTNTEITFVGIATLDTASHQDTYLNNAIFLDNPVSPQTIYLDFANNEMMNKAIGKNVAVTGYITVAKLDDGTEVTELNVQEVKLR